MQHTKWVIKEPGEARPANSVKRKVPYTTKQRIKDGMTDSEKRGIEHWNLMIDVLKENNLMEDK